MRFTLFAFLAFISLSAGCRDDENDVPAIVDPGPAPVPGPEPESIPEPDPGSVPGWMEQGNGIEGFLKHVTAVDVDHAWAAGGSDLYRTVNGGSSWTKVGVNFPWWIEKLQFFDRLRGWVLSPYHLYSTSDGGLTWVERLSIPAIDIPLKEMSFIDMNTGWVSLNRNEVWKTTDGGATWTSITFTPSEGNRWVEALEFVNSQVGWILTHNPMAGSPGAEILKTTDGGLTWNPQFALGYRSYLWDICAISPTSAWAVGNDDGEIIVATTDGGATWMEEKRNNWSTGLHGVHFIDANVGWAVGIKVQHTVDGGATWTIVDVPQIGFSDVSFVNATTGWVVGQYGLILKSTMIEPEPSPQPGLESGWVLQDSSSVSNMTAISAIDGDHAWTAGRFGAYTELLRTQDGGSAWTFMGPGPSWDIPNYPISSTTISRLHFFDQLNGWRKCGARLQRTTDGGQTWTTHWDSLETISSMCWLSPTTGWVMPRNGELSKTTDGGETWTSLSALLPSGIGDTLAVSFVNEDVGWIAVTGIGGRKVFKTVNGGQTWSLQLTIDGHINDLVAVSADRAWLVGYSGQLTERIMATTDGATWTHQSSDGSSALRRVFFVDANTGWAIGRKIHHTTDGGATWTVQPTSQEWFRDLAFVSSTTGWVVGEDGVILKTTTGGN